MDSILSNTKSQMQKSFEALASDFATIRTGKPTPSLVENVHISAYGGTQHFRLLELASIHIQVPSTIVINPFDKSIIGEIERGIAEAKIGLSAIIDGDILRINLPPLTEERRKEFVKVAAQKAENGKVMIRQARHDAMEQVKKQADSSVSEDEVERLEKEIQKATDSYIEKIDQLRAEKEKELMQL